MKSIQFNQEQIEAYKNGATMLIVPIDRKDISISSKEEDFQSSRKFLCEYCGGRIPTCEECYGEGWNWDLDCESKEEFISKYSPIQKGDEFFIQEPFSLGNDIEEVIYDSIVRTFIASQMQEHQARFRDLECVSVEIKRVEDIHIAREMEAILGTKFISKSGFINIDSFDILIEQFEQAIKELDYIFLYTIKGISK